MRLQLIRHATLLIELAGSRFLVDPMLDPAGARPAIANTPNHLPNPLTELPADAMADIATAGAIIVSHLHQDHYDATAAQKLPHDRPLFCQPADAQRIQGDGFTDVRPVETETTWRGITIARTGGQHGTGDLADRLAPVSGFVLTTPEEPVLYIAGDTIWCYDVDHAIAHHRPDVVVVNAGAARFLTGDPITMDVEDILRVLYAAPEATVVAIHMDAINHCLLHRADLRAYAATHWPEDVRTRLRVPDDGEWLTFA